MKSSTAQKMVEDFKNKASKLKEEKFIEESKRKVKEHFFNRFNSELNFKKQILEQLFNLSNGIDFNEFKSKMELNNEELYELTQKYLYQLKIKN